MSHAVALSVLFSSVLLGVVGQLVLKNAMDRIGPQSLIRHSLVRIVWGMVTEPRLWLGLGIFGASAALWIIALGHVDLSYAYPILASNLLFVTLGARMMLGESVSRMAWFSVGLIAIGIVIVTLSA
jgi:drug/metabolite transporter (DMT)-like permease